jgi:C4-dicarboxylate transporter, DctQ subunit
MPDVMRISKSLNQAGLRRMLKFWDWAEQMLAGALGLAALALALWQVMSRYLFPQQSISCAEEVIVYLLIWAIMIVASQLVRADGHVRPDLVLAIAPDRIKRRLEAFNILAAILFCAALAWYGRQVVATALLIDERSATGLRFPMWLYDAALPAGAVLMLIRYVMRLAVLVGSMRWRSVLPRHPGAHEAPCAEEPAR